MFVGYPFVKQQGIKDCGVSSLLMVIKYYKGNVSFDQLRDMTKTNKNGTTAYHLIEAAKEIGFDAKGVKCNLEDLNKDNVVLPAIAHITINDSLHHFVVIYKINFKKKTLIIADPADKIKKMTFTEFVKIWNNILIILYPITKLPLYKNDFSLTTFIFDIIKNYKHEFINIFILSIFLTIFSIVSSFFFKYMIDGISYSKDYLLFIFLLFLLINLLKIITDFFRNKILILLNQKVDVVLTIDTFKQIILLPYHYYCNRTTGEIVSRINDLSKVREMITKVAHTLFIDLPLTTFAIIILFLINFKLTFISLILLGLYIINIIVFKPLLNKYIQNIQAQRAAVTSYMVESISGFETVKGIKIEEKIIDKFEKKYVNFLKKVRTLDEIYNYQYILKEFVNNFGFIVIIYIGTILVVNNELTVGELLTFNALLNYFLGPIRSVIDMDSNFKEAKSALKRILDVFYDEIESGLIKKEVKGDIVIKNLNYSYNDRDYILKNINLKIKEKEKVLIVGESGSGKSTLLKILMKYYQVSRDQIIIGGIDINDYSKKSFNESVAYISQKEMLFTDTLENNLNFYKTNTQMLEFAKLCEVDKIIKNHSTGFKTLIEENGNNISGGEKQRIVLARSLLKPFNLLIIDEGLNQMDINLERRILKRIMQKFHDKTIIVVTHRLANIDLFDKIVELEKGRIKKVVSKHE